jgi:hypothetical protein
VQLVQTRLQNHIAKTLDTDPEAGWIFIVDQLNIHQSESLVRLVAERCGIKTDLGIKKKMGISSRWRLVPLSYLIPTIGFALSTSLNTPRGSIRLMLV